MSISKHPLLPKAPGQIFLIGMPAAGKTYWGTRLAKEYQLPFLDLDTFIETREKATVGAIFAAFGEQGFREKEHKWLMEVIGGDEFTIVACGGGTPCFHGNMELMKRSGVVVYLETDISDLLQRIKQDGEVRPLLKGRADMHHYLADLLQKRKQVYEQAHYILQTKDISLATFAEIMSLCINKP